jgi:CRP/FNR family transcriptional regulator, nitrogen fixation regulation protein
MLAKTEARTGYFRHQAALHQDVPDLALLSAIERLGFTSCYSPNIEIYGEQEPAQYLYKVVSGAIRTYKMLENGRRQIAAFYVPGDVFGLETRDDHTLSAEAISQSKLLLVKRRDLIALASHDIVATRFLWTLTAAELRRVQDHILLFAMSAEQRVAGFLMEMAERLSTDDEVKLPMARRDIADYLGLTIETVSRSLTHLEDSATIKMPNSRRIVFRDYAALGRLSA